MDTVLSRIINIIIRTLHLNTIIFLTHGHEAMHVIELMGVSLREPVRATTTKTSAAMSRMTTSPLAKNMFVRGAAAADHPPAGIPAISHMPVPTGTCWIITSREKSDGSP